ncbi:MAG TPA: acyl carrier protein [Streptosporangiaceae bacterium]|nr:acyl carrier protein [Streptosporangiaceae bacterium]
MSPDEARAIVADALHQVAPEIDIEAVERDADFRDTVELDSLDFLNFVEILSERTGRRIEEDDYPDLATFDSCVKFLSR